MFPSSRGQSDDECSPFRDVSFRWFRPGSTSDNHCRLLRLWISDELRDGGFTVLEAADADEALQILTSSVPVQVVLTDVRMPGRMDGVALAEWLRRERPDVKVIIASSHVGSSAAHVSITKPYSADQVINIIADLVGLGGTQSSPAG